ncbi:hypothetical protein Q31a_14080 [Aureliella helgolandensis]|uniref:Uncharacterized protein n=1 Tax=Aureliella helgolandensis TaxID=2527968 RepID=A0A518G3E3_9BACT|nr:hypothetical protein Q31a_14080 [Aureliella helgolandensis]
MLTTQSSSNRQTPVFCMPNGNSGDSHCASSLSADFSDLFRSQPLQLGRRARLARPSLSPRAATLGPVANHRLPNRCGLPRNQYRLSLLGSTFLNVFPLEIFPSKMFTIRDVHSATFQ